MGDVQDEWTTIDRKASKKKSREEVKQVVDDGWEQVNKKDKKRKDTVTNHISQQNSAAEAKGIGSYFA